MENQSNIIVEQTRLQSSAGIGYDFNIPSNYVVYFEREHNQELSLYIRKNYVDLKARFSAIELNFIYFPLSKNFVHNIDEVVAYYLPQLNYFQIPKSQQMIVIPLLVKK